MATYNRLSCISRLLELENNYLEIVNWLIVNKLISKDRNLYLQTLKAENRGVELLRTFRDLESNDEDVQMVDYLWNLYLKKK